jgi:hypothetical protein
MTEPTGGPNAERGVGRNPLEGFTWSLPAQDSPYQPTIAEPDKELTTRFSPVPTEPGGAGGGLPEAPVEPATTPVKPWWKRPLTWAIAGGVILLAGVVVAIVIAGGGRSAPAVTLPASTVTLPQPTPTISPSALPADATAFLKAQPAKVRSSALVSTARDANVASAAVESWLLGYSDGSSAAPITVTAEQFADAETAKASVGLYLDPAVVTSATPAPTASAAPTATAASTATVSASPAAAPTAAAEYGPVTAGGQVAGTYYFVQNGDKTETVVWFNGTALFVAKGPAGVMKAFFLAYPL